LDAYEPTPKRRVGQSQVRLGGREFEPALLIGAVLGAVLAEAVLQHNGVAPEQVVLTHPVLWKASRRRVLEAAFTAAAAEAGLTGIGDPVFVQEPVAAARWYALKDPPKPGDCFGVYDLGGGTFDTAVLRATADDYDVVKSGGIDTLGGYDFDQLLLNYLGERYIAPVDAQLWAQLSPTAPPPDDAEAAGRRRRLHARVRLLKEQLTTAHSVPSELPGVPEPVLVTRDEYEALIADRIEATVTELEDTIAEAGLTPQDLTAIYRIGGAARTPLVGAALDRLHLPVRTVDHPKLVVAQGAATLTTTPPLDPSEELFDRATRRRHDGDPAGAQDAYRQVIALHHHEWAPHAAYSLGQLCEQLDDIEAAKTAYHQAINFNHPEWAPKATTALAKLHSPDTSGKSSSDSSEGENKRPRGKLIAAVALLAIVGGLLVVAIVNNRHHSTSTLYTPAPYTPETTPATYSTTVPQSTEQTESQSAMDSVIRGASVGDCLHVEYGPANSGGTISLTAVIVTTCGTTYANYRVLSITDDASKCPAGVQRWLRSRTPSPPVVVCLNGT
jgi:Hsp70 protein